MFEAHTLMRRDVQTVEPETDIYEAVRLITKHNITGLPVVNHSGEMVGILSEKDVLTLMIEAKDHPGCVADFMSKQIVSFNEDDSLVDIAECLVKQSFRRVPILSKGRLVGIISRRDIVRYILKLRHQDKVSQP